MATAKGHGCLDSGAHFPNSHIPSGNVGSQAFLTDSVRTVRQRFISRDKPAQDPNMEIIIRR